MFAPYRPGSLARFARRARPAVGLVLDRWKCYARDLWWARSPPGVVAPRAFVGLHCPGRNGQRAIPTASRRWTFHEAQLRCPPKAMRTLVSAGVAILLGVVTVGVLTGGGTAKATTGDEAGLPEPPKQWA